MPGEPMTSSIVPLSMPGWRPVRGSAPPAAGRWHVPQATLPSLDSCSSQNRILPSTRFGSVIGFSAGTGTARQLRGKPRARRERQHEHESAAFRHSAHSKGLSRRRRRCVPEGIDRRSGRALESSHAAPISHAPMSQRHVEDVARHGARRLAAARRVVRRHPSVRSSGPRRRPALRRLLGSSRSRRGRGGGRCRFRARRCGCAAARRGRCRVSAVERAGSSRMHEVLRPFPSRPEPAPLLVSSSGSSISRTLQK